MLEEILFTLIKAIVIIGIPLGVIPLILQVERRGAGFIQRRLGPNRVGPFGFFQPLTDVFKFLFKEEVIPSHVKTFYYMAAPIVSLLIAVLPLASIPLCSPLTVNDYVYFPEVF